MSPQFSEEDIAEEQVHFSNVVATFQQYAQYSLTANNRRRKDLYRLPHADKVLLDSIGYRRKLQAIDDAILANADFLRKIVANPEIFGHGVDAVAAEDGGVEGDVTLEDSRRRPSGFQGQGDDEPRVHNYSHDHLNGAKTTDPRRRHGQGRARYIATDFDMDKLRSTLKQFVRDWSEDGKAERDLCYELMKSALEESFEGRDRQTIRVLVPGAGLGRLAYDVAKLGFACQGNEFSHYMLLSSYLILNRTESIGEHTIYPYIHSFSNIPSKEALLRPTKIPDVLPDLPPGSDFSLVAGDFEEIYGAEATDESEPHAGQWDAVLTCFFIDTAKNIVNYLRIIHRILAPGGVWINLGPLLWHFENNSTNDPSIELDLEEVKALVRRMGFRLSDERTIETSYTSNDQSMLGYIYKAAFWKATKDSEST
ncbi:N2227-domain-containing protein [Boletus edulis]|nr:N2227-domain-containing protein [Boletus edulis]